MRYFANAKNNLPEYLKANDWNFGAPGFSRLGFALSGERFGEMHDDAILAGMRFELNGSYCKSDCGCAGGQSAKACTFIPSCDRCFNN